MIAVTANDRFLKINDIEEAFPRLLGREEKWKLYPDFEAMLPDRDQIEIIFNSRELDGERIGQFRKLRWVFSYSAGVERYPLEELRQMGVILTNTSGVHSKNIAEQVLGGMIMFSRNLLTAVKNQGRKLYDGDIPVGELSGQNLLILGTGAIGREIARKAKAFDMHVTGIRKHPSGDVPEYFDAVYPLEFLDEQLGGCHYVVCVLPSTEQTRRLFDRGKFSRMEREAVFINVGRGDLIAEEDLIEALRTHTIKGAYLDVYPQEPVPPGSRLWELDNLLMTPHNAGPTPHYFTRAMEIFAANLRRFRNGEELINRVDYRLKY